VCRVT